MRISILFKTLLFSSALVGCANTVVSEQEEQSHQNTELNTQYYAPQHAVIPGIAPHHVAIVSQRRSHYPLCSGALIDKKWVITADQCLNKKTRDLAIVAGTNRMFAYSKQREVINVKKTYRNQEAGLALLELSEDTKKGRSVMYLVHPDKRRNHGEGNVIPRYQQVNGWRTLGRSYPSAFAVTNNQNKTKEKECVADIGSPQYGRLYSSDTNDQRAMHAVVIGQSRDCQELTTVPISMHDDWIEKVSGVKGVQVPLPMPGPRPILMTDQGTIKANGMFKIWEKNIYLDRVQRLRWTVSEDVSLVIKAKNAYGRWYTVDRLKGNNKEQVYNLNRDRLINRDTFVKYLFINKSGVSSDYVIKYMSN